MQFSFFSKQSVSAVAAGLLVSVFVTGCGSGRLKARQEQREKMVQASGMYCEFVNGEKHSDFDVELNLQMAKRCDSSKAFSLVPYKNLSDQTGILYCCAVAGADHPPGNSYAPPIPRRTNPNTAGAAGPAVRRVNPTPSAAPAPAVQAPAVPQAAPAVQAPAAGPTNDAADLSKDEIVEDK
jgi:hypothetical protein